MNQRKVQRIVPAMMLFEGARDQLEKDGLLRPIARDSDHIWQQMEPKFFEQYLNTEKLFMKAHRKYDDYDEKKLPAYLDTCYALPKVSDAKKREELEERLKQIEQCMYISCWYSSADLSDMVFREYSKNGIALGTDVGQLIRCLDDLVNSPDAGEFAGDRFYVGNVQYVYHQQLMNEAIFENTQVICPMFLKGVQFKVDSEFRVCVYREGDKEDDAIFVGKIPPRHLIRRVAFRADREHLAVVDKLKNTGDNDDDRSRWQMVLSNAVDRFFRAFPKVRNLLKKNDEVDISLMETLKSKLENVGLEIVPDDELEDVLGDASEDASVNKVQNPRVENGFIIYELREKK